MSQDDLVVANAPRAAIQSDMNSAFQALASTSFGAVDPATITKKVRTSRRLK